jgi:hypothetical protein
MCERDEIRKENWIYELNKIKNCKKGYSMVKWGYTLNTQKLEREKEKA